LTREQLFGDWHGVRPALAGHGIIADLQLTQFYQGVSSGGVEQRDAYGGKVDYMFTISSEPLGLWKGLTTILHAETRFGEAIVGEAGDLATPNTNMLYPLPGQNDTAITGLLFLQALNERFSLVAGKIHTIDFWTMFYPNVGRGVDGFMNLNSLAVGMPWFRYLQLSENGAGILAMKGQQPQGAFVVFDPTNVTTTSGLNNLFDDGAAVMGLWKFFTDYGGKPGSHLFAGGWSSRKYTSLDDVSIVSVPGQGLRVVADEETGAWTLAYYFDQVLWTDPCNEARKLQLFTGASLSDGNPSFSRWNVLMSVEAFGLLSGRERDRAGVAYFYNGLSNELRQLVSPLLELQEVQGAELYYNAEITPWFHLTGDFQVVDNEIEANEPAFILGMRGNIKF
jgi:porin